MPNTVETPKTPGKCPAPEGTWFQITFTLEPKHYRALWVCAEERHQTIADFVREHMIDLLEDAKSAYRKRK